MNQERLARNFNHHFSSSEGVLSNKNNKNQKKKFTLYTPPYWLFSHTVFPLISPVLPAHATPIKTNCKAIKTVYWVITNGEFRLLQTKGSHKKEI